MNYTKKKNYRDFTDRHPSAQYLPMVTGKNLAMLGGLGGMAHGLLFPGRDEDGDPESPLIAAGRKGLLGLGTGYIAGTAGNRLLIQPAMKKVSTPMHVCGIKLAAPRPKVAEDRRQGAARAREAIRRDAAEAGEAIKAIGRGAAGAGKAIGRGTVRAGKAIGRGAAGVAEPVYSAARGGDAATKQRMVAQLHPESADLMRYTAPLSQPLTTAMGGAAAGGLMGLMSKDKVHKRIGPNGEVIEEVEEGPGVVSSALKGGLIGGAGGMAVRGLRSGHMSNVLKTHGIGRKELDRARRQFKREDQATKNTMLDEGQTEEKAAKAALPTPQQVAHVHATGTRGNKPLWGAGRFLSNVGTGRAALAGGLGGLALGLIRGDDAADVAKSTAVGAGLGAGAGLAGGKLYRGALGKHMTEHMGGQGAIEKAIKARSKLQKNTGMAPVPLAGDVARSLAKGSHQEWLPDTQNPKTTSNEAGDK